MQSIILPTGVNAMGIYSSASFIQGVLYQKATRTAGLGWQRRFFKLNLGAGKFEFYEMNLEGKVREIQYFQRYSAQNELYGIVY